MSKTSDMSGITEALCQAGAVMELPMLAFHQGRAILSGGSGWTRFEVARSESYSGQDVERELRRLGVTITGRGFVPGDKTHPHGILTFHVKASQRRWCEYILRCARFNVVTVVDTRNATWAELHDGPIPAWSGRPSKMGVTRQHALTVKGKSAEPQKMKGGFRRLIDWLVE